MCGFLQNQSSVGIHCNPRRSKKTTITEYRSPRNLTQRALRVYGIAMMAFVPYNRTLHPGGTLNTAIGLQNHPVLGKFIWAIVTSFAILAPAGHFGQLNFVLLPDLEKNGVRKWSGLWWKWVCTQLVAGIAQLGPFEELEKELEGTDKTG